MEWMIHLYEHYGYFLLFFGLFTESIALPFPGELAMAISGHMSSLGTFSLPLAILCSFLGATIGTSVTYFIGLRLGMPFFEKYGKYVMLKPDRLDKFAAWYGKYGKKLLLISYFIPGLRHFTGYVSGILKVRWTSFFLYNHIGALLWVVTYSLIGRLFGKHLEHILHRIAKYSWRAAVIGAIVLIVILVVKKYRKAANGKRRLPETNNAPE